MCETMSSSQHARMMRVNAEVPKRARKSSFKSDRVFCYCREPEGDRFMIECDSCDEWYHGDCIQISYTDGKKIDKYYCSKCVSKNPEMTTTYKKMDYDQTANPIRCTECVSCTKQPDCGKCARCKAGDGRCMEVVCLMERAKIEEKKKENQKKRLPAGADPSHQCWGPGCVNEARVPTSKYCSDDCGRALAKARLEILKKKSEDYWRIEPANVRMAREEEERLKQEAADLQKEKYDLDRWRQMVIEYVDSIRALLPDDLPKPLVEDKMDEDMEDEVMIGCVVCGEEYGSREIMKHIEVCFSDKEKHTTSGTKQGCNPDPYNILCDKFNQSNNTYCKRLRVVCPEHHKGEIEAGLQVCGYPKVWTYQGSRTLEELFEFGEGGITENGLCKISRGECTEHCGWITAILGLIDTSRLAYHKRVEEVLDLQKRAAIEKKGNAWLIMASNVEYHQP